MLTAMNPPVTNWQGQTVWVIGASSGIGSALAQQALTMGARVVLSARRSEPLALIANQHPQQSYVLPLDVSDADAWPLVYQQLKSQIGLPDLVIYSVADYRPEKIWQMDSQQAQQTVDSNLLGFYRLLQLIVPDFIQRGRGGLGVIASVAGYLGLSGACVYGPTKAALINLAEILYNELKPKGLSVYLINPGFVKTQLTDKNSFRMPALQTPEQAAVKIWQGISRGEFEIDFPKRLTVAIKLLRLLPYRLRAVIYRRLGVV